MVERRCPARGAGVSVCRDVALSPAPRALITSIHGRCATFCPKRGNGCNSLPYAWRFNSSLVSSSGGYLPQRQQNPFAPSGSRPTSNDSRIQNAVLRNGSFWATHTVSLARLQTPASIAVGGTANPDIRSAVQGGRSIRSSRIRPQDTDSTENDFIFTSSTGTSAQNCQVPVTNGAPTPLNRDSPPSP